METNVQNAYLEEQRKLERVLDFIDKSLQNVRSKARYYGDNLTEQALDAMRVQAMRNLEIAAQEPYFGRLDFQQAGAEKPVPLYIGKVGVDSNGTNEPLVIDWRAPVASLFYSFTGGDGPAAYESPDGTVEGHVHLKRNLVIRRRILQRVVDTYARGEDRLAVADEFLLYRLSENKDNRLRDIVSTIQSEQDRIIRSPKNAALIIQGVAGSGKTTVALHRLAYLLYHYREQIRADKMIIFAPNRMFLDYISGVLPELGVGHIRQTTFSDWALDLLGHEVVLSDAARRQEHWFSIGHSRPLADESAPGRFKGSISFMRMLEHFFAKFEKSYIPDDDFIPWEGAVLPAHQIREWFYEEYRHYPLAKRCERVGARMKRWIEMQLNNAADPHQRKEYRKKANQRLRAYLKTWPARTPLELYRQFFSAAEPLDSAKRAIPPEIREATLRSLKKKIADPEDLAPLLYLRNKLSGIESDQQFDHTVIDEAQDFSPFQLALLREHTRENSFTILGDLAQGIHEYEGIQRWQQFEELFEPGHAVFHMLRRSYRSTLEIISLANVVLERSGQPFSPAVPVFRSGAKVRVSRVPDGRYEAAALDALRNLMAGNVSTIALIARTNAESRRWHELVAQAGIEASLIHPDQPKYEGGISVLPVYLAKGLEFDAVLLVDADARHYPQTPLDAKLLYVGCTRALHELRLLHTGEASPLIAGIQGEFVEYAEDDD